MTQLRSPLAIAILAAAAGCSGSAASTGLPPLPGAYAAPGARERVRISEFADLPRYYSYYSPGAIAEGPGGLLWVLDGIDQDFGTDALVGIETSGKQKYTYYAGSNYMSFQDVAAGSDGALWITDDSNFQVVRVTTDGNLSLYPTVSGTVPFDITGGPDKALWFTATVSRGGGAIERLTTKGRVTAYDVAAELGDIATGSDGALWFTENNPNGIGRITIHGKTTSYTNGITAAPQSIALGPDGAMWFTEYTTGQGKIGRITTSGAVTEYSSGITAGETLPDIAAGPDGAMWFTENTFGYYNSPKIGRISMTGHVHEYSHGLPARAGPFGIVRGPDKKMWFTDTLNDKTGRISF